MLKRLLKIALFLLAGFLILLIIVAGLTQTRRFKNWLRDEIIRQAAANINGTLHLGRIEGNLVSRFVFQNLRIELDGNTLLQVQSIKLGLSPFKLLKQQVLISDLVFKAPQLSLRQRNDSTWNVTHLIKPTPPAQAQQEASPWRIALRNLRIQNGALTLAFLDTSIALLPRRVQNISTAMRIEYAANQLRVVLRNLRFEALQPKFVLDSLAARITWGGDSLVIKNLQLRTGSSRLAGAVTLQHPARPIFLVDVQGTPLQFDDLRTFYPQLPATGPVQGSIHAIGDMQHVRAIFHLAHEHGRAEGNFFVLQDSTNTHYNLEAAVRDFNLNPYWHNDGGATRLNFDIKLDGSGLTLDELNTRLTLAVDSSQVRGRDIAHLLLSAQARRKQIQAKLTARSLMGEIDLSGKVIDPRHQQYFEVNAEARHLNLAALLQNDTLSSDISLQLAGSGKNFDTAHLQFDGLLSLFPSRLPSVLVDSAYCQFHVRGADVQMDTLRIISTLGKINAAGLLSLSYENNLRFRAELGDLTWVQKAMEADTLRARGTFSGSVRGPLDSLFVFSRFALRQVKYNTTSINRLSGNLTFHALKRGDYGGGLIQMRGDEIVMGYVPLDSAKALVHYDLNQAQLNANLWQGENNYGELDGLYTFGEIGRFDILRGKLNVLGQTWRTPDTGEMWMDIGDEEYDFHHFVLTSGSQRISVDGRLSYVGAEDLHFRIDGVNLATLATFMGRGALSSPEAVSGILETEAHVIGNAEAPVIQGSFNLSNGRIADFAFEKWEGGFNYENEKFSWQFTVWQNKDRHLTGEGYLPMNLALTNTGDILYYDRPIRLQAATTGIDLAFLQTLTSRVKQVQGTLVFDVKLENTLKDPRSKGALRIVDGAFSLPKYGVNYKDLQLVATIDTASAEINYFEIYSDKGVLEAGGRLNFTKEAIGDAYGFIKANNFLVTRNRNLEVRLNADIQGAGDLNGASYQGDLGVVRSRFFLPALQPPGVIEVEETTPARPTAADCTYTVVVPVNPMQRWLQNLQGELKITIPRNTWIRGPELNVEIEGTLDFVQQGDIYSLFGTLTIVRGTYELYGKRFDIDKGDITFEGDLQGSPQLNLVAHHVFRRVSEQGEQREKQIIQITISGDLNNPKISFAMENEQLEEKDALAYLIFGVSFDELRSGERAGLTHGLSTGQALSSAAQGLVTGLVSQQMAKSLGRSLNIDLIEFQSGQDITHSSVLVGKYITNDLFLSFSQDFNSPEGRTVSLEYEIAKFLFLQASHGGEENKKTGFDLIWKLDW